jgi:pyrroline-5-carboxylate reductase
MKYGFLGTGKMSKAIIQGMIKGGYDANNILGYNRSDDKINELSNIYKIKKCNSQKELIENSDIIILAVKPNVLEKILSDISKDIAEADKIIVSLAVGKTIEFLKAGLGNDKKIFRVMPNINSITLSSTTGYCNSPNVDANDVLEIESLFSKIGTVEYVPEKLFSIFSAIAGSSPAFSYMYINALATAAVKAGMPKDLAIKIAAGSVMGSANTILKTDDNPYALIDSVCSPGGTTIEGIASLKATSFESKVIEAIDKVLEKDELIRKGK